MELAERLVCPFPASLERKGVLEHSDFAALEAFTGGLFPDRLALAAMSGGVDSAVACMLAVRSGRAAIGVTMRLWSPGDGELSEKVRQCCGPTAYADARRAADAIGIAHHVVNFERAFQRAVIDYFCGEYLAGRTPNPCVACNNLIKFGALLDFARVLGAATLITGHYARVRQGSDGPHLMRAVDRSKDQSYMLAGLRPQQLSAMVLPLGELLKEDTRRLAADFGLHLAQKPDSMDLCFVDGDYRGFIERRFPESAAPGPVLTTSGEIVGQHRGLLGYTVGQRKGIPANASGDGPWYVVRTDRQRNAVVVGRKETLARETLTCRSVNVIRGERFGSQRASGLALCRYRAKPVRATARLLSADEMSVAFAEPVAIVTPGQLLALYDDSGEEVIASGIIER